MSNMKWIISGLCMGLFAFSALSAAEVRDARELNPSKRVYEEGECNPDAVYQGPCTCYCPVTRFRAKPYCEKHCVQEPYCVQKKCTRYVPQYYTKEHCRYVPQYYTKTYCRQVPECYYVTETKYRTRVITEQKCRYEPYTTIEKKCIDNPSCSTGGCATGGCATGGCFVNR